ncbi:MULTISPECIES: GntR family transcriptional regulator [unclassified Streptomyces]|uniref:GntR family transcriptional regulator n=1 Tax=unclassified Streptomyces TaxID=2593676 RepID=UPI0038090C5E
MREKAWVGRLPAVKSKADLVYENLRSAIAEGRLLPGERVNMERLARSYGVSKIPVREAVKRLESDGLVVSRVHAGATVAAVDLREVEGVLLARDAIDGLVAGLAAENADPRLLRRLEAVQRAMREAVRGGRLERLPDLNASFHRALARASGYQILADLTEQLLLAVRRYRLVAPMGADKWALVLEEHERIITAVRSGDPVASASAARAHVAAQARQGFRDG